jgi:drug/metabolite transporter (DMT)-like permease
LSITPTLIKVGLSVNIDPVTLLALRLLVAMATFWIVFALFWPRYLHIDRKGLAGCAAVAAANSLSLICYYLALTHIDVSVAHMIFSLYPVAALLFLALRGEHITRLSLARLGLAILGVYLLIGPGGEVNMAGVLLVLATATSYALHLTLSQWYLSEVPSQTVALYIVSIMAIILAVVRLLQFEPWQPLPPAGWGIVLVTGLVSTVLARLAMFAGIKNVGSGQTALLGPMETFLAILWAIFFLGERLSPVQWLGGLFILSGAALAVHRRPQEKVQETP